MFENGKRYKIMEDMDIYIESDVVHITKGTVFMCKKAGMQPMLMKEQSQEILPHQAAVHLQSVLLHCVQEQEE